MSTCPSASRATTRLRSAASGALTAREMFSDSRWAKPATAGGSSSGTLAIRKRSYDGCLRKVPGLGVRDALAGAGQVAAGDLRILGAHQRLPHQHGVDTDALELVHLLAVDDAGLRHHGLPGGHVGQQVERARQVHGEVGEVAVVDADHVDVELECALELLLVVDLHQCVEIEGSGL